MASKDSGAVSIPALQKLQPPGWYQAAYSPDAAMYVQAADHAKARVLSVGPQQKLFRHTPVLFAGSTKYLLPGASVRIEALRKGAGG